MKNSIDVLTGLLAVKELEIQMLKRKIRLLNRQVKILAGRLNELYDAIEASNEEKHQIGFKGGGQNGRSD